jgi:hypothetical protein
VNIADARTICEETRAAGNADPALARHRAAHGANFLAWWNEDPSGNPEQDLVQWHQITGATADSALNVLGLAREQTLPAADFQNPAQDDVRALEAVVGLRLAEETLLVEPNRPVDASGPELQGATLLGALCWQPEKVLNVIPFIEQGGNAAPFGHVIVDPDQDINGPLALHAGVLLIGQGAEVASAISIMSVSLCGATLRAAGRGMHFVVNALWQAERRSAS